MVFEALCNKKHSFNPQIKKNIYIIAKREFYGYYEKKTTRVF